MSEANRSGVGPQPPRHSIDLAPALLVGRGAAPEVR